MKLVNTSAQVRKQDARISSAALFDTLLIALMFTLLGSRFIVAPGMGIDLSSEILPSVDAIDKSVIDSDLNVLNAQGNSMLIYDGAIYNLESFKRQMQNSKQDGGVLLIKADRSLDTQTLMSICKAARDGGFSKVQIAARPSE